MSQVLGPLRHHQSHPHPVRPHLNHHQALRAAVHRALVHQVVHLALPQAHPVQKVRVVVYQAADQVFHQLPVHPLARQVHRRYHQAVVPYLHPAAHRLAHPQAVRHQVLVAVPHHHQVAPHPAVPHPADQVVVHLHKVAVPHHLAPAPQVVHHQVALRQPWRVMYIPSRVTWMVLVGTYGTQGMLYLTLVLQGMASLIYIPEAA